MCHSINGWPSAAATSCASTVLPVPGSPLTSSGRCSVTDALTATSRSREAMYRSVLLKPATTGAPCSFGMDCVAITRPPQGSDPTGLHPGSTPDRLTRHLGDPKHEQRSGRLAIRSTPRRFRRRDAGRLGRARRARHRAHGQSPQTRHHRSPGPLLGRLRRESWRVAAAGYPRSARRASGLLHLRRSGRTIPGTARRDHETRPRRRRARLVAGHPAPLSDRGRGSRRHRPLRRSADPDCGSTSIWLAQPTLLAERAHVTTFGARRIPLACRYVRQRSAVPERHQRESVTRRAVHHGSERHAALRAVRQRIRRVHPHLGENRFGLAAAWVDVRLPRHHGSRACVWPAVWGARVARLAGGGTAARLVLADRSRPVGGGVCRRHSIDKATSTASPAVSRRRRSARRVTVPLQSRPSDPADNPRPFRSSWASVGRITEPLTEPRRSRRFRTARPPASRGFSDRDRPDRALRPAGTSAPYQRPRAASDRQTEDTYAERSPDDPNSRPGPRPGSQP